MPRKGGSATSGPSRLGGDSGAPPDARAVTAGAPPENASPCTILLVENEPLIAMATSSMLRDLGYKVVEAASGRAALAILRAGAAVDLVLTDQSMPGMTGTQLGAEIRASWPDLPVLLATGYAELPENAVLKLPRLDKPYGEAELAAAIARAVRTKSP